LKRTPASFLVTASALLLISSIAHSGESTCFGTSSNGRLEGGVPIPKSGSNFGPYSTAGVMLGRTYVHSKVAAVIEAAYKSLDASAPGKQFLYGESGWRNGGKIKPHKTHQNGLAVDFMVPVLNSDQKSVPLPTGITNKFGYDIEFDSQATYEDLTIDFEAIAEHLHALHQASAAAGIGISRVIFDRDYLPQLYATRRGRFLKDNITFMTGKPWIRHDEHYHVDFSVPCKAQ
jgi:penicillin-insensitive murein endopeptidase